MKTPRTLAVSFHWLLAAGILLAMAPAGFAQVEKFTGKETTAPQKLQGSMEHTRLYETPDPESPGGIEGRIASPSKPIQQILAIPPDTPEEVYAGEIIGDDRRSFRFTGLPMRKYDLLVFYEDGFYEGLQLLRGESTLTALDLEKIDAIMQKSEPFFPVKTIHRVEGETGRGNEARLISTFLRDKKSIAYHDKEQAAISKTGAYRRTFKLVILKDVGPGWQVVRARDLYPKWVSPDAPPVPHHYSEALSRIRVADSVKDVGELNLNP